MPSLVVEPPADLMVEHVSQLRHQLSHGDDGGDDDGDEGDDGGGGGGGGGDGFDCELVMVVMVMVGITCPTRTICKMPTRLTAEPREPHCKFCTENTLEPGHSQCSRINVFSSGSRGGETIILQGVPEKSFP